MDVVRQQQMRVDPEYIEDFRKDLLANVYDVNPRFDLPPGLTKSVDDSGEIFFTDDNGRTYGESLHTFIDPATGKEHNSVPDSERAYVQSLIDSNFSPEGITNLLNVFDEQVRLSPNQRRLPPSISYNAETEGFDIPQDVSGFAAESTLNNVPQPDIMPLTPMQQQAIRMSAQGIGSYEPMLDVAEDTFNKGIAATDSSLGGYDPSSYQDYMTPYEDVIDATYKDMDRQGLANMYDLNQSAIGSGAFGGSRGAVARQENARNIRDQKASFGAKIRMDAVNNARSQSMTAFENQAKRGQTAGQIFQGLGTAQAGLGQLGQDLGIRDQQNVLGMGGLEQQQMQAEYDVQRASAIEQNMEPYSRFGFMGDIATGLPSGNSAITVGTAPAQNTLGSTVAASLGIAQLGKQINRGP